MKRLGRGQSEPLCQLFVDLAKMTSINLRDAAHFGMDIGEESITDFLLLELKRRAGGLIHAQKFNRRQEGRTTGADWEWWFVAGSRGFGMRIQAKKLDSRTLKYSGIDHKVRGTGKKQIDLLISDATRHQPALYAAYLFYNYIPSGSLPAWTCGSFPPDEGLFGCAICDAETVKSFVQQGVQTLSEIGSCSSPWSCLVCCDGLARGHSLPDRAYGVVHAISQRRPTVEGVGSRRRRPIPEPVSEIPRYVSNVIQRSTEEAAALPEELLERPIDGILVLMGEDG